MIKIRKDHISMLMLIEAYSEKHKTEEKINFFKKKYNKNLQEFEKEMRNNEEHFIHFDDYMEWKAYENYLNDTNERIKEFQSGNIQIA